MKINDVSFHIMGDNMDQIGIAVNGSMLTAEQTNRLVTELNTDTFIRAFKSFFENDPKILEGQ